jgi:hypothetical protein
MLGHRLTAHVALPNDQEPLQALKFCEAVQTVIGHTVKLA